jgi:hypothetical protein
MSAARLGEVGAWDAMAVNEVIHRIATTYLTPITPSTEPVAHDLVLVKFLKQELLDTRKVSLILAAGDFDQVITKLGFYRTLHNIDRRAEHDCVKFLHHLAGAERTQIAPVAAGWATGIVFCNLREISPIFNGGFKFLAFCFSGNEDVTSGGLSHEHYSF